MKHKTICCYSIVMLALLVSSCKHINENTERQFIEVGVFNGNGASSVCVLETIEALKIDSGIDAVPVSAAEIMNGALNDLDVLVFPGGSGSKQYNNLGMQAADLVKEFAGKKNKGVVGICAGGYILASTPDYASLKMIPAKSIREHYNRGRGLMSFRLTDKGAKIFPELDGRTLSFVQYYDGPIYNIADSSNFDVLAQIESDIATHKSDPRGLTPGKPAFATSVYGDGRIFISVGHPESTRGMRWMVPRMTRWTANAPLISYSKQVVRPDEYQREIFYYPETISFERENFWKLSSENDMEIMEALNNLKLIYSRPSIRWSIGLLRHSSPAIRVKAAVYLLQSEYTWAIPDVEAAYDHEKDADTKKKLGAILDKLKNIVR